MTVAEKAAGSGARCSDWARETGLDPVATAGSYDGFLLVEWPLPWPRDASEAPGLETVGEAAAAKRFRLQLVSPADRRTGEHKSREGREGGFAAAFRWDGTRFAGREVRTAADDPGSAALALLADDMHGAPIEARDVLVCGHGRRDRCCGSLGTALAAEYAAAVRSRGELRIWRTSHTGGHRFAPTALLLPEGTMWAYLDAATLDAVVHRRLDPTQAAARYRGCAGLATREAQAVERSALALVGWSLFDGGRRALTGPGGTATLYLDDGGHLRTFSGQVSVRRRLAVPGCGATAGERSKSEEELTVSAFWEEG